MYLEVYIPTFSVIALLAVTAWITSDAVNLLLDSDDSEDVDVSFLFGFSAGNLFIDVVSVGMFMVRGKDAFRSLDFRSYSTRLNQEEQPDTMAQPLLHEKEETPSGVRKYIPNLNMISAMTHIIGDTLRSSSVFIAALISSIWDQDATLCDAWAAVIVTITIVIAIIPLIMEIYRTYCQISEQIRLEESSLP